MPPIAAPTWWADVQQEREDLGGRSRRPVEEWLDEDLDFAPRSRFRKRTGHGAGSSVNDAGRSVDGLAELRQFDLICEDELSGKAHELHGVFVHAESAAVGRMLPAVPATHLRHDELALRRSQTSDAHALSTPAARSSRFDTDVAEQLGTGSLRGTLGDNRYLAEPPPVGERRTVHITGHPERSRLLPTTRYRYRYRDRQRPRTTADRIGPRPDRIALWVVIIGIVLILVALSSTSPT